MLTKVTTTIHPQNSCRADRVLQSWRLSVPTLRNRCDTIETNFRARTLQGVRKNRIMRRRFASSGEAV